MSRALFAVVFCSWIFVAHADEFSAKVIAVFDGDTVLIKRDYGVQKVRLAGIDAPEKTQTFGETSKQSLAEMVYGKQVNFVTRAVDRYGRLVANLSIDGLDVNAEQIRRGMAWESSRFHNDKAMLKLQQEAKNEPRGLWTLSNPMPPWKWRKQHPFIAKPRAD